jgi:hypothetical protein
MILNFLYFLTFSFCSGFQFLSIVGSLLYKQDATAKILDLMEGKPDLIIGNYTDGNLVASLMASKLGITQVSFLHQFMQLCIEFLLISIFTNL